MNRTLLRLVYQGLVVPLLLLVFRILALAGHKKIAAGLRMRRADSEGRRPWQNGLKASKPIWIHCASGEFEYAKPVIQEIKRASPDQKILVTYFSPSVKRAVESFPDVDFSAPSPLESRADFISLIRYHRPTALLIARTDTWPIMLRTAKERKIPTLLFSATLSESSGRVRTGMRSFTRWVFSYLDQIYCVSEADQAVFTQLGFGRITQVAGDTRFDQVTLRLASPRAIKSDLFGALDRRRIFTAGSTWPEDEVELVTLMKTMKKEMRFIVAPHEPTASHLQDLEEKLSDAGLTHARYTRMQSGIDINVVVVDQIGILAELYQLGSFAFVGGSFKKTVHSVMEPLAAGCVTFLGPLHQNNREALEFKKIGLPETQGLCCVMEVTDSEDWYKKLSHALQNIDAQDDREFIREQVHARSGRSQLVAKWALNAGLRSEISPS